MSSHSSACPSVPRVVLVGLAGATYDVLVPLAASGTMPNLHRFLASAALIRLGCEGPPAASVAWETLYGGGGPGVHGLLDDCRFDHHLQRIVPGRGASPWHQTLSAVVAAAGGKSAVVSLDDLAIAQAAGSTLRRSFLPIWQRKPADFAGLSGGIARTAATMRDTVAAARRLDQATDWRLLDVRFRTLDSLLQRLSHLLGIGGGPGGNRQWVAKTREAFRTLDDCLGELLALAARRNAAVVLVSPYGFAPFRGRITVAEILRRRGLLHVARGTAALGYQLSRLAGKVSRRLLHRATGRPLAGLLPIDWRRTQAVALHGESAAMIYLNTPARFGTHVLVNPRQREQAAAEVLAALHEARHPVSNEPLFAEAYCAEERFDCDPLARGWPDIVAIPVAGLQTRYRLDRNRQLVRHDAGVAGARHGEGLLIVAAPGIRLSRPCKANLVDVAPTVLQLLGLMPAEGMSGGVVEELFAPSRWVPLALPVPSSRPAKALAEPVAPARRAGV